MSADCAVWCWLNPVDWKMIKWCVQPGDSASLARLLGYNGNLVCLQYRPESPPLPAFSSALQIHEVALNGVRVYASVNERRELCLAGEQMFVGRRSEGLRSPALLDFLFADLPEALHALKSGTHKGKGIARLQPPAGNTMLP